jgi:signal transduction histidine kinase
MKMSLWRSAIFRLLLIYGFVFAGSMSGLVCINYWESASYTSTQADYNIAWQFAYFSELPADKVPMQIAAHIRSEMRRPINFYGLFTSNHQWIAGDILAFPENVRPDGDGVWSRPQLAAQTATRPEYMRTKAMKLASGDILVVSRDVDEMSRLRAYMLGGLAWSAAIVVVGGLAIGILLSTSQLRRVSDVRRVVQQIARGDFEARLPETGRDEISWLSTMVNHMLDEVSRLMHEVKGACDGIAHDLRTPVIHIRSLLARIPDEQLTDTHAQLLLQARAETEDVLQRFAAIMRISEIESIKRKKGFSEVEIDALCQKVADLYQPVAAANGLTFAMNLRSRATIRADYPLMFEVLVNLLDNAIKFTPEGGTVRLQSEDGSDGPTIVVSDTGPGIPDEERSAVFQRFYRSDLTSTVPGSGLGLSVVQAVVRLHDFGLTLSDANPGLCVRLDCWAQFKRD